MRALDVKAYSNRLAMWLLLVLLTPILAGCFGAAALGVGTSVMFAVDRRPAETIITDEGIEMRSLNRIAEKVGDRAHVNVTSFNHSVLLTGEVPDEASKADVEKLVSAVPNVKTVRNELQVAGVSSLIARSNDTVITSKVKARFVDAADFSANHVKVVTEAGVVYLLGLVTKREADAAAEVARNTNGPSLVVRMFESLDEEEARRIDSRAAAPAASKKP